jgi:hypothetical protein
MSPKMARLVVDVCNELPFVNWDRFIDLSSTVLVFGWIDRKQDSYKDFVTVEVNSKGNWSILPHQQNTVKKFQRSIWLMGDCQEGCMNLAKESKIMSY